MDGTQVLVAGFGMIGLLGAAAIPTFAVQRARGEMRDGQTDIKKRVGVPNGQGDLAQMNEKQLESHAVLEAAVNGIAAQQEAHSLLDTQRFKALHEALNIPYEYPEEPT